VAATFYTVFESARTCGTEPAAYLRYATEAVLHMVPVKLPHEWMASG
jgi:hypothetical protein